MIPQRRDVWEQKISARLKLFEQNFIYVRGLYVYMYVDVRQARKKN